MPLSIQNHAFLERARRGSAHEVVQALRDGADLLSLNARGRSALHLAVEHDHLDVVTVLLLAGMDPDTPHAHLPLPPLMLAVRKGLAMVTARLLDAGAAPHGNQLAGIAPMTLALLHGHLQCALTLAGAGASWTQPEQPGFTPERLTEPMTSEAQFSIGSRTPLHTAAQGGHVHAVEHLLGQGAPVHARDDGGFTPLHHAVTLRQIGRGGDGVSADKSDATMARIVQRLLEAGARIDAQDRLGRTPLDLARERGRLGESDRGRPQAAAVPLLLACLERAELCRTLDQAALDDPATRPMVTPGRPLRRL